MLLAPRVSVVARPLAQTRRCRRGAVGADVELRLHIERVVRELSQRWNCTTQLLLPVRFNAGVVRLNCANGRWHNCR